jgi:hypothetical protein
MSSRPVLNILFRLICATFTIITVVKSFTAQGLGIPVRISVSKLPQTDEETVLMLQISKKKKNGVQGNFVFQPWGLYYKTLGAVIVFLS